MTNQSLHANIILVILFLFVLALFPFWATFNLILCINPGLKDIKPQQAINLFKENLSFLI